MSRRAVILFGFVILYQVTIAQDRYFVYFKSKTDDNYPYSIHQPTTFLSEVAIQRRTKQGIELDSTDLPVNPSFVAETSAIAPVFFTSKWLNGVLAEMDSMQHAQVSGLSFVDSIRLVAKGARLQSQPSPSPLPTAFQPPVSVSANTDIQLEMLGADQMIADSILGQGMLIAVFDNGFTGVDTYSPFRSIWEENRLVALRDFVENSGNVFQFGSHGTAVFSTIAAQYTQGDLTFMGTATKAKYVLCVTEDNQGENAIEEYNWLFAAEYADSLGVDIINSSLGYRDFDLDIHDYDFDDLDGNTAIVSQAALLAAKKGMLVVTSAGNSGRRVAPQNSINHPADTDSILTVGSVKADFNKSDFSSIGPTADQRIKPDVCAFGDATAIVQGNGRIQRGGGTSFASPLIAGLAAGIWQMHPTWTAQKVIAQIKQAAHQSENPDNQVGYGVPYYPYLKGQSRVLDVGEVLTGQIYFYPNPFKGDKIYLKSDTPVSQSVRVEIFDSKGVRLLSKKLGKGRLQKTAEINFQPPVPGIYYLSLQTGKQQRVVKLLNLNP